MGDPQTLVNHLTLPLHFLFPFSVNPYGFYPFLASFLLPTHPPASLPFFPPPPPPQLSLLYSHLQLHCGKLWLSCTMLAIWPLRASHFPIFSFPHTVFLPYLLELPCSILFLLISLLLHPLANLLYLSSAFLLYP